MPLAVLHLPDKPYCFWLGSVIEAWVELVACAEVGLCCLCTCATAVLLSAAKEVSFVCVRVLQLLLTAPKNSSSVKLFVSLIGRKTRIELSSLAYCLCSDLLCHCRTFL